MRTVADKVMLAACKGRTRSEMTTLMQGMKQKLVKFLLKDQDGDSFGGAMDLKRGRRRTGQSFPDVRA